MKQRIKKESPNEGTETVSTITLMISTVLTIKKESPNEGTETRPPTRCPSYRFRLIKKESPNEGTETSCNNKALKSA